MLLEFLVGHPEHGVCTFKMVLLQLWFPKRDPLAVVYTVWACPEFQQCWYSTSVHCHLSMEVPPLLFALPGAPSCGRNRGMLKALCPPSQPQTASAPYTAVKQRLLGSSNPSTLFLVFWKVSDWNYKGSPNFPRNETGSAPYMQAMGTVKHVLPCFLFPLPPPPSLLRLKFLHSNFNCESSCIFPKDSQNRCCCVVGYF